jgi:hypothetical protein
MNMSTRSIHYWRYLQELYIGEAKQNLVETTECHEQDHGEEWDNKFKTPHLTCWPELTSCHYFLW